MEYGLDCLKRKLGTKAVRVNLRYKYYDMKSSVNDLSSIIPQEFKFLAAALGWCAKAVDSIADRIVFDRFGNDDFYIGEIFALNNSDILFDDSVLSAMISACSFIYIGWNTDGYPTLEVVDGGNATGIIDPVTKMLSEGYAVLERDQHGKPVRRSISDLDRRITTSTAGLKISLLIPLPLHFLCRSFTVPMQNAPSVIHASQEPV